MFSSFVLKASVFDYEDEDDEDDDETTNLSSNFACLTSLVLQQSPESDSQMNSQCQRRKHSPGTLNHYEDPQSP